MRIPKITWAIAGLSSFWIIMASIRWFIIYPDPSQAFISVALGIGGLLTAYIYWYMKSVDDRLDHMHTRVDKIWEEKGIIV